MTVKELKEVLEACNDDAEIIIQVERRINYIYDSQIWQTTDGKQVIFDPSYRDES